MLMKRKLIIPMKPISNNRVNERDQRFRSSEYLNWMPKVCAHLRKERNSKVLKELREKFNHKKHYASVSITVFYPEEIFFTKKGWISKFTIDKSNDEKALLDVIFNKDFEKNNKPHKLPNIKSDDCYVADLHSYKRPIRGDFITEIEVEIFDIEDLWIKDE